ncbi:MAG: hypothetical protein QOF96_3006 [Actinomycetota bacterium]|nr:hypothetical protein [Actinomycetota bacterium]
MPSPLSRSFRTRLVVVVLAGLLAAGLLSSSALPASASDAGGRVGGLVLDSSNHPMAGATITLTDTSSTVAGSAHTNDQGRWLISAPQGDYDVAVTAEHDGHTLSGRVRRYTVGADTRLNVMLAGDPDAAVVGTVDGGAGSGGSAAADTGAAFTRAAAATQSASGKVTFSGAVLDVDGNPVVSGVHMWLSQLQTYFEDITVSADGSFSLEVPPGPYSLGVATGVIEDDCPGCPYEPTPQTERDYEVDDFQLNGDRHETIRLPRPAALTVTVVDPADQPVPGAWVSTLNDTTQQRPVPDLLFAGALTKVFTGDYQPTGADGQVDLEYIPGAAPASVSVDPPPGTTLPGRSSFPPQGGAMTIRLQDGPTLHGRLVEQDGAPLGVPDAYLAGDTGPTYPFGATNEGYAVTAPAGSYRMVLRDRHDEEGESSDYLIWSLTSDPFQLTGDRTIDLTVPLGYARLWAVDDNGQPVDGVGGVGSTTSQVLTIADGITATATTEPENAGYDNLQFPVVGPSTAQIDPNGTNVPAEAYVAPGEDTVIAFIPGTGPNDRAGDIPTTTTTTTTGPTTTGPTTTTPTAAPGTVTADDPPAGPGPHAQPVPATLSGYWALSSDGHVYNFGDAKTLGDAKTGAIDLEPTPTGAGYWILDHTGQVTPFGDAPALGGVDLAALTNGEHPASLSATPTGKGYWIFTDRGRAIPFGDAQFLGDMSKTKLNGPILGSVATPSGKGYYMVASDGGIFAFGDAGFSGSMGGHKLNAPVQSLVPDGDGHGYWLVATDGGIFAFDAPFRGSMGATKLNRPISGMVRYGNGYLMVGGDGGMFNFSSSPFAGSLGDKAPASPVVAVAARP